LAPREDVAYEGGYYNQQEEHYTNISGLFVKVRPVVKSSGNVYVDADEEEGCSVGVHVSDQSAVVDVSADVGHRGKGSSNV